MVGVLQEIIERRTDPVSMSRLVPVHQLHLHELYSLAPMCDVVLSYRWSWTENYGGLDGELT